MEPAVIDPFLEIDPHGSECGERAAPVEARVDILGGDLADPVVHGASPCEAGGSAGRRFWSSNTSRFGHPPAGKLQPISLACIIPWPWGGRLHESQSGTAVGRGRQRSEEHTSEL